MRWSRNGGEERKKQQKNQWIMTAECQWARERSVQSQVSVYLILRSFPCFLLPSRHPFQQHPHTMPSSPATTPKKLTSIEDYKTFLDQYDTFLLDCDGTYISASHRPSIHLAAYRYSCNKLLLLNHPCSRCISATS